MIIRHCTALILLVWSLSGCASTKIPHTWKTDCVGRMQINLPAATDVAAETINSWKANRETGAVFADEQPAGWSGVFFGGPIKITHVLDPERQEELRVGAEMGRDRFRPGGAVEKRRGPHFFEELSVTPLQGVAWDYRDDEYASRFLILSLGAHMVSVEYASGPDRRKLIEARYRTVLNGLRERPLFDVPHEPGVCLPYAFIRDDGTTRRRIGMTYRLREHPDVTIWLEDANAATDGPHVRSETHTARYRAKFFWEQDYKNAKRVASEWAPGYRRTEIDGREALETFVKLVRYEDNIEDYGYLAVVRGDPDAAEDSPDLMLYVIRDAANATKRGIAPIGRDELLEMARTIAASVKKRPVH